MIARLKSGPFQILIGIVVVGLVLIFIDNASLPGHGRLNRVLNNAGHIPLFGILALAMLAVIRSAWTKSTAYPLVCYFAAFSAAGLLGAGSELMQYIGPRDADLWDLLRDLLGAGSFLVVVATFDRSIADGTAGFSHRLRIFIRWTALSLLAVGLSPVVFWSTAYCYRNTEIPVLCSFDSFWHTRFVHLQDATLAPDVEDSQRGARLTFGEGRYPGFSLEDVYPDWTLYDSLIIEINSPLDSIIKMGLRIDDVNHDGEFEDRYTGHLEVRPGANRLAVSLIDIKHGPHHRLLDMQQIASMWIYGDSRASGTKLLMQQISLK